MTLLWQGAGAADDVVHEIKHLKDGVYLFREDGHNAVFMVTEEGIVMTDPLNRGAATWLKKEIKERFGKPIRYVIYSHNHSDHIYGGDVYDDDGVVFVGHREAKEDLVLTSADTAIPDMTFTEKMTVELGGKKVILRYHGPNDGRGSISMMFLPARVLFAVDWVVLDRMPWRMLWSFDIHGMIKSVREIEALDFDIIAAGHSVTGRKEKVVIYRKYLEALRKAVVEEILAGKSLNQMKKEIRLDEFSHLQHYEEWLPLNVEGVYYQLKNQSGLAWRPLK
jgi:glyoxylase-like metal-dependent hydrolase (beta-lactamase superfamily II)